MDQPSDPPGILFVVSRWCHHREVFRSDEGGARAALQRTALPAAILPESVKSSVRSTCPAHRHSWPFGPIRTIPGAASIYGSQITRCKPHFSETMTSVISLDLAD